MTLANQWKAWRLGLLVAFTTSARAQDPFAADVRATPWLAPEEAVKTFTVPPGFTITCFAHEPDLFKPMNLAFDARGRLWCTSSAEYPYPVKADKNFAGRDKITIHEDTDGDGRADKVTVFADGLDIPIGLLPTSDGCVVFSIPNIWRLRDTDGDDRADVREVLYGPMGWERDTHGLNNSFRRGFDGWIYANHGYNNRTNVKGRDGHEVHMESGNSYRFRLDGSRIEQFTSGQVNPFGSSFDPRGDLYTADCHTLPITILMRGGCYESFGKPHDGLGFVPQMMHHLHGSTALCGLAIADVPDWPAEFRGNLFVGNVMSCRVHRDALVFAGSTPKAVEQPDLIATSDPWFRPVDLQIGPDGALYVADFYNRIIGHYEVPLDHPGRDRESGRVWRLAWQGEGASGKRAARAPDLRHATVDGLIAAFAHPTQVVRMRALDEVTDRVGQPAVPMLADALAKSPQPQVRLHSLWALFRLGALEGTQLERAAQDNDPLVRVHLQRLLAETPDFGPTCRKLARAGLEDRDAFVRRAAVEALGRHPEGADVAALVELHGRTAATDELLVHAIRIALRDELRAPGLLATVARRPWTAEEAGLLASICLAVEGEEAAGFLLDFVEANGQPGREKERISEEQVEDYLGHVAQWLDPAALPRLTRSVRQRFAADTRAQLELIETIQAGLDRRGAPPDEAFCSWAVELAQQVLAQPDAARPAWFDRPVPGTGKSANPWVLQVRRCEDGKDSELLSSLPRGETLTGILRSPRFPLPPRLSFFIAGHNGEPERAVIPFNKVRLVDAQTEAVLVEVLPPRNDVAQKVELDLTAHAGKTAWLELIDSDPYDAYAWLAAGRFEPPLVPWPARSPADQSEEVVRAVRLAGRLGRPELGATLLAIVASPDSEPGAVAAAAEPLFSPTFGGPAFAPGWSAALLPLFDDPDLPEPFLRKLRDALVRRDPGALDAIVAEGLPIVPSRVQAPLAKALAMDPAGATLLLDLVATGKVPATLLVRPEIKEAVSAALPGEGATRVAALTKDLQSEDEARQKLVNDRRRSFARFGGDAAHGAQLFAKNCAACHKLGATGAVIGPQLEGIASRGFERLCEDLLVPNRNVDIQFRRTNYFLKNGDIVSALFRREEGALLVVADETGKERALPKADVDEARESRFSLMPDNLGELLSEEEFRDLLAYLMEAGRAR